MNLSLSGFRAPGAGPQGPSEACFNLSRLTLHTRGSGGSLQHQQFPQVVAYPFQPEVTLMAHSTHIVASLQPVALLQGADDPLHGPANWRREFIPPPLLLSRYHLWINTKPNDAA